MSNRMDLTEKVYQRFVYEKINDTDWSKGTSAPLVVELDTTEACDLACPNCISADVMETQNRFSNDRLLKLGREFYQAGVKAVVLIGGGEPLAHPAVGEFMEYLGEHDIHIGITTNGTFIRKHLDVIAKYSRWTRVSMDAASEELFGMLRPSKTGKSRFAFIVENMRMLARIKKGKLGYSYLIQTEADGPGMVSNVHEIFQAAELAKNIGCDYFEVKPSYQYRDGVDHALMKHDQSLMQYARDQIERLDELETDGFKVTKAINLEYSLEGVQELQIKNYVTCPSVELRTLVTPSGAYVCPYWRGKEKMNIGDLHDNSFRDIWDGQRRNDVVNYLNPSRHCSFHCLRHATNNEVLSMIDTKRDSEAVEISEEYDRFI
ncbi:MAG: radical SAM protein [Gammaproteobacteria bacterium]|nr:MAG: radical SAM protein [Gammaproteobacteria bacterium]